MWNRLCSLAPKAKAIVGCLIRIATKSTAAAFPESEVLVNVVGAATEAAAEEALAVLAPAQKAQAEDMLGCLVQSHVALIDHLAPLAEQAHSVQELSNLVRQALKKTPAWHEPYRAFARDLAGVCAHSPLSSISTYQTASRLRTQDWPTCVPLPLSGTSI